MPYNRPDSATTLISLPQALNRLVIKTAKEHGMTKADVIAACIDYCLVKEAQSPSVSAPAPSSFANRLMAGGADA